MKSTATATHKQPAKGPGQGVTHLVAIDSNMAAVYQEKATAAQRHAAVQYLLDHMPPPARAGQKTAQEVLKEIREGGK